MRVDGPCCEAIGRFPRRPVVGVGGWGSGEGRGAFRAQHGPRATTKGSDFYWSRAVTRRLGKISAATLDWAGLRQDSKPMLCEGRSPEAWPRNGQVEGEGRGTL